MKGKWRELLKVKRDVINVLRNKERVKWIPFFPSLFFLFRRMNTRLLLPIVNHPDMHSLLHMDLEDERVCVFDAVWCVGVLHLASYTGMRITGSAMLLHSKPLPGDAVKVCMLRLQMFIPAGMYHFPFRKRRRKKMKMKEDEEGKNKKVFFQFDSHSSFGVKHNCVSVPAYVPSHTLRFPIPVFTSTFEASSSLLLTLSRVQRCSLQFTRCF